MVGNVYWLSRPNDKIPPDYEKAKRIYRTALTKIVADKKIVLDRLKELKRKKWRGGRAQSWRQGRATSNWSVRGPVEI